MIHRFRVISKPIVEELTSLTIVSFRGCRVFSEQSRMGLAPHPID